MSFFAELQKWIIEHLIFLPSVLHGRKTKKHEQGNEREFISSRVFAFFTVWVWKYLFWRFLFLPQLVEPDSVKSTLFQGGTRCSANVKWKMKWFGIGMDTCDTTMCCGWKNIKTTEFWHCGSKEVHRRSADTSSRPRKARPVSLGSRMHFQQRCGPLFGIEKISLTPSSEIVVNIAKLFGLLSSFLFGWIQCPNNRMTSWKFMSYEKQLQCSFFLIHQNTQTFVCSYSVNINKYT